MEVALLFWNRIMADLGIPKIIVSDISTALWMVIVLGGVTKHVTDGLEF